jgi:hypothetical protein
VRLLEDLDTVNWAALEHAYGKANDVPQQIRDLFSSEQKQRADAIHDLYGNIWHQGTVYEATAYAVPFLAGVLVNGPRDVRVDLLALLAEIADGSSYLEVHGPDANADGEVRLAREREWVRAARSAVAAEHEIYQQLLREQNNEVKLLAAFLLGTLKRELEWDSAEFLEKIARV